MCRARCSDLGWSHTASRYRLAGDPKCDPFAPQHRRKRRFVADAENVACASGNSFVVKKKMNTGLSTQAATVSGRIETLAMGFIPIRTLQEELVKPIGSCQ